MKILVVSDTHGAVFESIAERIKKEKDIDLMIHCGDKFKDAKKLAAMIGIEDYYNVVGNCDYDISGELNMLDLKIEGKHVLITHGHLQNVKDGLDDLQILAEAMNADIVLFGHTHISHDELINNIHYFNPGSTILPKNGKASYGIVEISDGIIKTRIVQL